MKKRKLLAWLLALVMVMGLMPTQTVSAATTAKMGIKADKTTAYPGDTINYTVEVEQTGGIGGWEFVIEIPAGLTLVESSLTAGTLTNLSGYLDKQQDGSIKGTGFYNTGICDAGQTTTRTLASFSVTVDTNATLKDYTLQFKGNSGVEYYVVDDTGYGYASLSVYSSTVKVETRPISVTGVTIDETLSVDLNGKATPSYTVAPTDATNKNVTFTSSDDSVATVNATTGEVTGVKEGTATITVTTADGSFSDTCLVTVKCVHANKTEHPAGTSSCTEQADGKYYTCDNCGKMLAADGTTVITSVPKEPLASHTVANQIADKYLKSEGTCQQKAVYYKSCSVCQVKLESEGTFEGELGEHKMATVYTQENNQHFHKCTTPGCTHTDTKVNCSGGTATCQKRAVCSTCGNEWGDVAAHNYASTWSKDETGHWYACQTANCSSKKDFAGHTPNINEATETEDKVCVHCSYMIQPKLGHLCKNHLTPVTANPAQCEVAGNEAYYVCECNKWYKDASASVEITDKESVKIAPLGHDYSERIEDAVHLRATVANCQEKTSYWYDCSRCDKSAKNDASATDKWFATVAGSHNIITTEWGYKVEAGHAHKCEFCDEHDAIVDHTAGEEATETTPQVCTECGYVIKAALGHSFGTEWKSDKDNHWNVCACGEKGNVAAHTDANKDAKCDICGHEVPLPTTDTKLPPTGDGNMMILWIALLFIGGFSAVAMYADKKRKN